MPHIILEVPKKFDIELAKQIINISQHYLVDGLPAKLEGFKCRIYNYEYCCVAGNQDKELVHMQIKVLAGRKQEHLDTLSTNLRNKILEILNKCVNMDKYTVTLEISELSSAYAR
ncbi:MULTISPECIES: hypothetical protein [unclassified Francisella]|uniref:hypothetical protein n=1 Tax=unclassified Francisella TaxID=2610885 RepID=UPI002E32F0DF|nr:MULTISPECIES: hypothetical protein [unclassified Francisella]MED7818390.1 hypothetical protein [Francisella sp. 19S2-4]MED7829226.1 hypothetical protein [Francisella sp. 19S2-10]